MEEEFSLISKTIGKTLIDLAPTTLILTASPLARLHLFSEYGIIQEIFNFEISLNQRLNLITVQCDDTANLVLIMIHNAITNKYNIGRPLQHGVKWTREALFHKIEELIKGIDASFVLSLNNIEDLRFGDLDEILSFFRVNLVPVICTCDRPNLYDRLKKLTYATVHIIEGFTRWQLKIIYEAMLRRFNFELPEFSIDVLINLQFEKGNRFPYFGKDIFTGINKNPD